MDNSSPPPVLKREETPMEPIAPDDTNAALTTESAQATPAAEDTEDGATAEPEVKRPRKATAKRSLAEASRKLKDDKATSAATLAQLGRDTGISRAEEENGFALTLVRSTPLINQKNYFTDYLKKDEQVGFIRTWRKERDFVTRVKKGQVDEQTLEDAINGNSDICNFEYFDVNEVVSEMNKNKSTPVTLNNDDPIKDDDDDDDIDDDEDGGDKSKNGYDVIVIHPGSLYTRIGRATDTVPKAVPTVIAVPTTNPPHQDGEPQPHRDNSAETVTFGEEFDSIKEVINKDFRARMKYYKRRILPNSHETACNFNRKQSYEEIPDHNDPDKVEWINLSEDKYKDRKFFVGDDALKLPIDSKMPLGAYPQWKLRYPIVEGRFNENLPDYNLPQEIMGDLTNIIVQSLSDQDVTNLDKLKCILIIPDLYDKTYVETWMLIILKLVGFLRVGVIQELVAATFGAGATLACVVDVGAQTTLIACVEEGMIVNDLRIRLNYGGDQVTELFMKFLLEGNFPYNDINLRRHNDDWQLAQQLKELYCTFQDADIAVQLYNFYKRKPYETTKKYDFKVFDSVMMAPLGLYFPKIFGVNPTLIPELALTNDLETAGRLFSVLVDQYSDTYDNPVLRSQQLLGERPPYSDLTDEQTLLKLCDFKPSGPPAGPDPQLSAVLLEKAIIELITNTGLSLDMSKTKKMYDNLLIVGGGLATIPGFDLVLADRISIWRPKFLSTDNTAKVIEFAKKELKRGEDKRVELINELKLQRRTLPEQTLADIELTPEEIADIDAQLEVTIDLEAVDAICEQGEQLSVSVLPPPREFDPQMLTWKGGSVFGRLKVVQELWITKNDWEMLALRCLYYKLLWQY
ncbi:hypothetical protein JNB11_07305 [Kocuria palustris]|nr:hypothetical protein [Kocuria palustris]